MADGGLLLDNSVYARRRHAEVLATWTEGLVEQRFVACDPFLIEALSGARSGEELRAERNDLLATMRHVACDQRTWQVAFDMQQAMADAAGLMHRRKPLDFLIAALAHQHGLGVLHYDRDYDLIAEHGGRGFASVWVAPAGSLGRGARGLHRSGADAALAESR